MTSLIEPIYRHAVISFLIVGGLSDALSLAHWQIWPSFWCLSFPLLLAGYENLSLS
jgi:hypothetical protein